MFAKGHGIFQPFNTNPIRNTLSGDAATYMPNFGYVAIGNDIYIKHKASGSNSIYVYNTSLKAFRKLVFSDNYGTSCSILGHTTKFDYSDKEYVICGFTVENGSHQSLGIVTFDTEYYNLDIQSEYPTYGYGTPTATIDPDTGTVYMVQRKTDNSSGSNYLAILSRNILDYDSEWTVISDNKVFVYGRDYDMALTNMRYDSSTSSLYFVCGYNKNGKGFQCVRVNTYSNEVTILDSVSGTTDLNNVDTSKQVMIASSGTNTYVVFGSSASSTNKNIACFYEEYATESKTWRRGADTIVMNSSICFMQKDDTECVTMLSSSFSYIYHCFSAMITLLPFIFESNSTTLFYKALIQKGQCVYDTLSNTSTSGTNAACHICCINLKTGAFKHFSNELTHEVIKAGNYFLFNNEILYKATADTIVCAFGCNLMVG